MIDVMKAALSLLTFLSVLSLPSCGIDKARAANYALELERCELETSTCEGYVACRKQVAERFGRRYNGRCE